MSRTIKIILGLAAFGIAAFVAFWLGGSCLFTDATNCFDAFGVACFPAGDASMNNCAPHTGCLVKTCNASSCKAPRECLCTVQANGKSTCTPTLGMEHDVQYVDVSTPAR